MFGSLKYSYKYGPFKLARQASRQIAQSSKIPNLQYIFKQKCITSNSTLPCCGESAKIQTSLLDFNRPRFAPALSMPSVRE